MKKNYLLIILILLILIESAFLAYFLIQNNGFSKSKLVRLEKSLLVKDLLFSAEGEVVEISGKNLTLTYQGESLQVFVGDLTRIQSTIISLKDPVIINFDELKAGDLVTLIGKINSSGKLEAINIIVTPRFSNQ